MNITYPTFSVPTCMFPDVEDKLVDVAYEPVGCETELNNDNCRGIYTCNSKSATCTCTQDNNNTDLIECYSESVTDLIMNCDTKNTKTGL